LAIGNQNIGLRPLNFFPRFQAIARAAHFVPSTTELELRRPQNVNFIVAK
jgi:hypothetical protein